LRLLLLPRPGQQLSVQILKRRGPVLGAPLTLDLPQPVTAIRLRARPTAPASSDTLHTLHARPAGASEVAGGRTVALS
jgi:hypothetical protein